jgi:hypothetical protein
MRKSAPAAPLGRHPRGPSAAPKPDRLTRHGMAPVRYLDKMDTQAHEAAALLVSAPPDALVEAIRRAMDKIWRAEWTAMCSPSRSAVRERLDDLAVASLRVAELLEGPKDGNPFPLRFTDLTGQAEIDVTPAHMRMLAERVRAFSEEIRHGRGSDKITDAFGHPRGRLVCAVAAVRLIEIVEGRRPGKGSRRAMELCAAISRAAGLRPTPSALRGDVDDIASWERHLKDALLQGRRPPKAAVREAERRIEDVIRAVRLRDAIPEKRRD